MTFSCCFTTGNGPGDGEYLQPKIHDATFCRQFKGAYLGLHNARKYS